MKYQIIMSADLEDFAKKVEQCLAENWSLQGGVFIYEALTPDEAKKENWQQHASFHFAQAMTRAAYYNQKLV